jgi:hypothetical protein
MMCVILSLERILLSPRYNTNNGYDAMGLGSAGGRYNNKIGDKYM